LLGHHPSITAPRLISGGELSLSDDDEQGPRCQQGIAA